MNSCHDLLLIVLPGIEKVQKTTESSIYLYGIEFSSEFDYHLAAKRCKSDN